MNITFEQAKALEAVVKLGTIQKAAKSLNKGHSAVMYLIKGLEEQTQLKLFDRSSYRNQITPHGEVVLKYCQQMLLTKQDLEQLCLKLQEGWEPSLKLIYDGVVDFNLIADTLFKLNESQIPTRINVQAAYLHEVESTFINDNADLMVTILPIKQPNIVSVRIKPIKMLLVAHKDHALSRYKRKKISLSDLNNHTYLKIKGNANQLGLSTESIDFNSSFSVNDFTTKKQAIQKKLGFGWLPEYLIKKELKMKSLQVLRAEIENEHTLRPRLYHRREESLGKTAQQLIKYFRQTS